MRRLIGPAALLAIVVMEVPASAQTRTVAPRARAAVASANTRQPQKRNTSNTAFRNQMKKFSDPLGANGR